MAEDQYKIKLEGTISGRTVIFNTMPSIYENNSVGYQTVPIPHLIGDYRVFENTHSRTFEMNDIKFVSRNQKEARQNLERIQFLKAWTKPYFGQAEGATEEVNGEIQDWLGAPPEVLWFSALATADGRGIMSKIPVLLEKVSINYPNDVDYIPTASFGDDDKLGGIPFPLLTTVAISVVEQHSPYEYENFNLSKYRSGTLSSF